MSNDIAILLTDLKELFKDTKVELKEEEKTLINNFTDTRKTQIQGLVSEFMRDTLEKAMGANSLRDKVMGELSNKMAYMTPQEMINLLQVTSTGQNDFLKTIGDLLKKADPKGGSIFINQGSVQVDSTNTTNIVDKEMVSLLQNFSDIWHTIESDKTQLNDDHRP